MENFTEGAALCSSANKSPNWSSGNSTLVGKSRMRNSCTETQVLLISSSLPSIYFLRLCIIYSLQYIIFTQAKILGMGQIFPSVISLSQFCWKVSRVGFFSLFACLKLACLFWLIEVFGRGFVCFEVFVWFCLGIFLCVFGGGGVKKK